jgi:6-phosphogluconate dehydrogenase (decarboxylating)
LTETRTQHGRTPGGEDDFANKLLSALRLEFGGHEEKKP